MDGNPAAYIAEPWHMASRSAMAWAEHKSFYKLNEHMLGVLHEMGMQGKVRCGCIVRADYANEKFIVVVKTIVGSSYFMHEELWEDFPSDHFKTRLLLACG